jgi:hypothetical protein
MVWSGSNTGLRGKRLTANHRCHGIAFYEYITMQYAFSAQSSSNIRNNIFLGKFPWKWSLTLALQFSGLLRNE